ncbi:MAG TPA: PQQ-binding-like beta-propeller repeat protein [Pirellulales bacterium]|nr:PQQ-binding-like beta-propeller repeat protein [Pirellulales bacterium]
MKPLLRNQFAMAWSLAAGALIVLSLGCSTDDKPPAPRGAQTNAVNPPQADQGGATTADNEKPTLDTVTAVDDKPAGDKAADDKATDDKATDDKAADDKATDDKATDDKAAADKAAADKAAADKATDDKATDDKATDDTAVADAQPAAVGVGPHDWGQWGGSPSRNNTPDAKNVPVEWEVGEFDGKEWKRETSQKVKWVAQLGSQSYGNPVVANGKAYVGTNNGAGWLARYPNSVDLGCLLCFNEADGEFLWQHSSEKLPTGRVHDWEWQGICCAPLVENDRLWFVTSRGQVACLDTEGFRDGKNDGPFQGEANENEDEADVIWYLDMMGQLKVSQHNMCSCSVTAVGDVLFVCTSNGVDESHSEPPSPAAPSFLALDKRTGKILWQDNSPGKMILHGQWSSPGYAVIGGVPQVLFGGGDGWLYSFRGDKWDDGKPELLWKFDCNPKESKYAVAGRSTRNHIIGTPLFYEGLVYIAVGEDPEHGEGNGHLWCIDPKDKHGDVSSELAFKLPDLEHPMPHTRRLQSVNKDEGEVARDNPNSAAVWHYTGFDRDGDGKLKFEEQMHRTCGTATIKNGLLFLADFSGLLHCLDAKTGQVHWTHDLLAATWGSALIVEDQVYIGDEEGKISIFGLSADPAKAMKANESGDNEPLHVIEMGNSVYTTPIVANDTLFIADKDHLFAITSGGEPAADKTAANDE